MGYRAWGSALLGLAAAMATHNAGVPWWRNDWQIGDATDIGVTVGFGIYFIAATLSTGGEG